MKKCILHGFHEELRSLGDSWRIAFFTDFLNNAPLVGFVDNWFGELHEEQHVSRSFMKNCVFRGFHDFCVGFMQNCFLQGSTSSRIAFLTGLMIYCILHGFHEELDFPCVSWLIAVPLSCVGSFFLHRLDEQSHCSRIPWRIAFSWTSCRIAYSAGYTKTRFCHWAMKNRILHGSHEELHSSRLPEEMLFGKTSGKRFFFMDFMKNRIFHNLRQNFTLRWFHEKSLSGKISWRIGFFMGFMKNCIV